LFSAAVIEKSWLWCAKARITSGAIKSRVFNLGFLHIFVIGVLGYKVQPMREAIHRIEPDAFVGTGKQAKISGLFGIWTNVEQLYVDAAALRIADLPRRSVKSFADGHRVCGIIIQFHLLGQLMLSLNRSQQTKVLIESIRATKSG
jgi:hypothetical protein